MSLKTFAERFFLINDDTSLDLSKTLISLANFFFTDNS